MPLKHALCDIDAGHGRLHNSYRLVLTGESMRKQKTSAAAVKTTTLTKAKN